jgi:Holliday junction resolvasome RuvABC endonuclease subunit
MPPGVFVGPAQSSISSMKATEACRASVGTSTSTLAGRILILSILPNHLMKSVTYNRGMSGGTSGGLSLDGASVCLGVNVAARVIYLGVVSDERPVIDDPATRIDPSAGLDLARRLDDIRARFRQEVRRLQPSAVGIMRPRLYSGWKWSAAFDRATLEAAIMLAAVEEQVPCTIVRAEDAAKAVPAAPTKVVEQAAISWGVEQQAQWKERVWAYATAMALAKGIG